MARSNWLKTLTLIGLLAVVLGGCSSSDDPTAPINDIVVDTAPPAVPSNVTAAYQPSASMVTISWDANTVDTDLAGYAVEREVRGERALLTSTPILAVTYHDDTPLKGGNLYRVYAIDTSGNASAVATSLVIIKVEHRDPDIGTF